MTSNIDSWFTQGVNQIIKTSSISPSSGSGDTSDLERLLQIMELLTEIARDFSSGHASDAAIATTNLNVLLNDPKYHDALVTAKLLSFVTDAANNAAKGATIYLAWYNNPNTGANNIIGWLNMNVTALDALFNSLPTDPLSQSFSKQQMDDIRNLALIMVDMIAVPSISGYGKLDAQFFKGNGIAINLPNMLLAYYYQQNVSRGDPNAYQDAIAQLGTLKNTFPPPAADGSTPNYAHMLSKLNDLLTNPPSEADFKTFIFDYFAMVAQQEHGFIG